MALDIDASSTDTVAAYLKENRHDIGRKRVFGF